ncbi:hypothetical protein P691DRAFT_801181 [Macrolepiota fuliginosa MF-IS2]|uniref:Uncharacterized protein n=1 Tax=Macrolepiota fuliginosa MF-IS2 TaxID=1400762 RepID=A0A9P5XMS2_9AGAR|nr:hypothetical protein P691DRAFT_801181 [Macrolepiota fuliginosa MF-IS2]
MARQPLHPQAQRIRTIIWSVPLMVGSGYILYRRFVLGEEQRKFGDGTSKSKTGLGATAQPEGGPTKPSEN